MVKAENKTVDLAPKSTVSASPESEEQEVDLDIHFADPSHPGSQITTERMMKEAHPRTIFGPPPRPFVFGFADNSDALVFRHADGPVKLFALPAPGVHSNSPLLLANLPESSPRGILQPDLPFLRPLIAAAKAPGGWRFAWPTEGGIELVESSEEKGNATLVRLPISPLLSGQLGGIRLRFSASADYVILAQQRTWSQPVSVRIWDLDKSHEDSIMSLDDSSAERLSCSVALFDKSGNVLTHDERAPYEIPEPDGACP
jgi:hypothetical protein